MEWVALVTCLALLFYVVTIAMVGQARGKYGVKAPKTTGHETFERYLRVQLNTSEQLIVFLPSIWMFAYFVSPKWASLFGLLFVIGRVIYLKTYVSDPAARGLGMSTTLISNLILLIGGLVGTVLQIF